MLTKEEIVEKFSPNDNSLINDSLDKKENIIKTALIKEKYHLNLYLPLNIPIIKKERKKENLYDKEKLFEKGKKLEELKIKLNTYSHKPNINKTILLPSKNKEIVEIIKSLSEKKRVFKEINKKNDKKIEKLTEINGHYNIIRGKKFHLNNLIKKVKKITKSVDSNIKKKNLKENHIIEMYKRKFLSNKKDPKAIQELETIRKNRENILLKKMILNIEYDNVVNRNKNEKKNNVLMYTVNNYETYKENEKKMNNLSRNIFKCYSKRDFFKERDLLKKKLTQKQKFYSEEESNSNSNSKIYNYESELLERKNNSFFNKYNNCLRKLKDEEIKHYNNKVFKKCDIEKIMKSKNDLEIDKLKYDYSFNIGQMEYLNKTSSLMKKKMNLDIVKKKKEISHNKIENKLNTAFKNEITGLIGNKQYEIEEYLKKNKNFI